MKILTAAAVLSLLATSAYAQSPAPAPATIPAAAPTTCKIQASDKKLAGAALNSFMKKCQTDAKKSCDTAAAEKKLSGAAKNSFTKKCVTDAVGS